MKITDENYLAFNLTEANRKQIIDLYSNEIPSQYEERELIIKRYLQNTKKNYLLTKSAIEIIENIKINYNSSLYKLIIEKSDFEATIIIDKENFIRYYLENNKLNCIFFSNKNNYLKYEAFSILGNSIHHGNIKKLFKIPEINMFLKIMIFIKCTNVESEILSQKKGSLKRVKIDNEKYLLESSHEVILIHSKYNKILIRNEKFYVNTHGRFQRHGKDLSLIKYIIIEGYYKKGYIRSYKK